MKLVDKIYYITPSEHTCYITYDVVYKRIKLHDLIQDHGIMQHWGTKEEIVEELRCIADEIEKMNFEEEK